MTNQSDTTLSLLTNVKNAGDAFKSQLESALAPSGLPAQASPTALAECQEALDAITPPLAKITTAVNLLTEEHNQTQPSA